MWSFDEENKNESPSENGGTGENNNGYGGDNYGYNGNNPYGGGYNNPYGSSNGGNKNNNNNNTFQCFSLINHFLHLMTSIFPKLKNTDILLLEVEITSYEILNMC